MLEIYGQWDCMTRWGIAYSIGIWRTPFDIHSLLWDNVDQIRVYIGKD